MKTLASGWCPKHDRVYRHARTCPDCGTALILLEPPITADVTPDVDLPPPPDAPADAVVPRAPWPRRLAIAAALLAAFGLGSIVPRSETPEPVGQRGFLREIHLRDQIGRSLDGATIFLGTVVQRSDGFVALFSPGPGAPESRLIEDAAVEITVGRDGGERTFSASAVEVTRRRDGFTVTGKLDSSEPIRQIRITSIQVREESTPEWGANLSKVWPVGDAEPRVLHIADAPRPVEGGTIRLASLVCWRDRIEAVFDLRGTDGTPGNRSEMAGIELRTSTPNASQTLVGRAIASSRTELTSAGQLIARFEAVPEDAGPIVIKATRMLSFVAGPWTWRLP